MKKINIKNQYQSLTILTVGATIHEWICFSDRQNIVISNKDLNNYKKTNMGYFNQTVGRVANRIKDGIFTLNGKTYQLAKNFAGNHHGHGGPTGFFMREFEIVDQTNTSVKLKYVSKHLEEGYPGELTLYVTYILEGEKLRMLYDAKTTEDTIINITNHAHFNLSSEPNILNHELQGDFKSVLAIDEYLIPTGEYIDIKNSAYDVTLFTKLDKVIMHSDVQDITQGLDHAFLFGKTNKLHLKYKNKNLVMETTYPGVQIYSMNYPVTQELLNNRVFEQYAGITFEPQYEPNAINIPHFNQPILKAGEHYHHETVYHIFEN